MSGPRLSTALVHYPILDPDGAVATSAITNLDLHDLARSSTTYGVSQAYVVSPVRKQLELAETVIHHWVDGGGRQRCPGRGDAFEVLRPAGSVEEVIALETQACGRPPLVVVTSAQDGAGVIDYLTLRRRLADEPALVLFGTARGLAPEVMERADLRLAPILGPSNFNHLSVRAAIAIVLDRLRSV